MAGENRTTTGVADVGVPFFILTISFLSYLLWQSLGGRVGR